MAKKEVARLEVVCYEDNVEIKTNGDENALIAGLAVVISDDSKENEFNNLVKTAITFLMMDSMEALEEKKKKKAPVKKSSKKKSDA